MKNTIRKACWLPLVALCVLAAISCEKKDPKVPLEASLAQTAWQGTYEYDESTPSGVQRGRIALKVAFYTDSTGLVLLLDPPKSFEYNSFARFSYTHTGARIKIINLGSSGPSFFFQDWFIKERYAHKLLLEDPITSDRTYPRINLTKTHS